MAAERGLKLTAAKTGEYVSGTLVGSTQLASGRFAMIDDGIGFQYAVRSTADSHERTVREHRLKATAAPSRQLVRPL